MNRGEPSKEMVWEIWPKLPHNSECITAEFSSKLGNQMFRFQNLETLHSDLCTEQDIHWGSSRTEKNKACDRIWPKLPTTRMNLKSRTVCTSFIQICLLLEGRGKNYVNKGTWVRRKRNAQFTNPNFPKKEGRWRLEFWRERERERGMCVFSYQMFGST